MSEHEELDETRPSKWRKHVAIAIAAIFLLSAAARGFYPTRKPESRSGAAEGTLGFVPGEGAPSEAEPAEQSGVEKALPYITEGSFFALIGFALGYLSRTLLKVGLVVLGAVAALLLGLSMMEVIDVDWERARGLANSLILNVKDYSTVGETLKDKIPSFAALAGGWALGFRR